jgi:flagellar biosynthesis chaperone FliJ
MNENKYQQVITELQTVIDDTQHTINRFEATGMEEKMPEDYETLLAILDDAVKQQQAHTLAMLGKP